jgi:hypothetical protein
MVSKPINGVYNSTAELYRQVPPSQQAVKESYAMAIQLKQLFFMIGKAKELYDETGIDE